MASIDPSKISFEVPDDVFSEDSEEESSEAVSSETDTEIFTSDADEEEPRPPEKKAEKKAKQDDEDDEDGEEPADEVPSPVSATAPDPDYLIAQQQLRLEELEQQHRQLIEHLQYAQRQQPDETQQQLAALAQRRAQAEQAHLAAISESDEVARAKSMFELQSIEREASYIENQRQVRELRALRESGAAQAAPPQRDEYAARTREEKQNAYFRVLKKVTPEEEAAIYLRMPAFLKDHPEWASPDVDPWRRKDVLLSLVRRNRAGTTPGNVALVQGGQYAAQARRKGGAATRHSSKALEQVGRVFGMSGKEYAKFLDQAKKKGVV